MLNSSVKSGEGLFCNQFLQILTPLNYNKEEKTYFLFCFVVFCLFLPYHNENSSADTPAKTEGDA